MTGDWTSDNARTHILAIHPTLLSYGHLFSRLPISWFQNTEESESRKSVSTTKDEEQQTKEREPLKLLLLVMRQARNDWLVFMVYKSPVTEDHSAGDRLTTTTATAEGAVEGRKTESVWWWLGGAAVGGGDTLQWLLSLTFFSSFSFCWLPSSHQVFSITLLIYNLFPSSGDDHNVPNQWSVSWHNLKAPVVPHIYKQNDPLYTFKNSWSILSPRLITVCKPRPFSHTPWLLVAEFCDV